jgi:hypothetical protein
MVQQHKGRLLGGLLSKLRRKAKKVVEEGRLIRIPGGVIRLKSNRKIFSGIPCLQISALIGKGAAVILPHIFRVRIYL